jgi:hypothetical protein
MTSKIFFIYLSRISHINP